MNMLTIAMRELRGLFLSPLAWSILAVVSFILAWLFLVQMELFLQLQPRIAGIEDAPGITAIIIAPLADSASFVLMIFTPLLSMRLIADERRHRTLALLFSAPVSIRDIVLGKYLGLLGFLFVQWLLILLMPLSLLAGGSIDMGLMLTGMLGLLLMLASYAAIGTLMSSLTAQPIIAAITTLLVLLLLWVIDWGGSTGQADKVSGLFSYLSIREHFTRMLKGVIDTRDVMYFLLLIGGCLVLTVRRLDNFRLQH
jgi:ABC-2 type transport system permease protein